MHEVLVNRLGGLSLPRKSVVRLTDRPDMTLDVYRERKTTIQQQQIIECKLDKPNAYATTKDLVQQTVRLLSHTICMGPKESTDRKQRLHGFTDWF